MRAVLTMQKRGGAGLLGAVIELRAGGRFGCGLSQRRE